MSAEKALYLDSSAIVKLVVREPETAALRKYLRRRQALVSSALARTEVLRAVMGHGEAAQRTAESVLARFELLRINDRVLRAAGLLLPAGLRTLDAIHLASALTLSDNLTHIVCYDDRLAEAATERGLATAAPD
jgi:predicted nucleic acid-binding protein